MSNIKSESTTGFNRVFKSLILIAIIGVIGSVVYTGSLMNAVAGVFSEHTVPMPFDSTAWKNSIATETHTSLRLRMSDDLVSNHLEAGMHESIMHAMLGYPDPYKPLPGYDVMYFLGSMPNDPTHTGVWLAIKLSARGEIEFYKVTTE